MVSSKTEAKIMKCAGCERNACVATGLPSVLFLADGGPVSPVTKIVLGVHPEVQHMHVGEGQHSIIATNPSEFLFCANCSVGLFDKVVVAITKVRPDQTANFLLSKPNEYNLDASRGHWLTYIEYILLGRGKFFSLQFGRADFKTVIKWLSNVFAG